MRVSSVELHQKLGQTIDKARLEPVVVTKHDRDHVVILSAEVYIRLLQSVRRSRRTGGLTTLERKAAEEASVPARSDQQRYLDDLAVSVEELLSRRATQ